MTGENYVTIIGAGYLIPISALLEKLASIKFVEPNDVQVPQDENACSSAVVILVATMIDSIVQRIKYVDGADNAKNTLNFIESRFKEFHGKLVEIQVIRDLLVHNHVWDMQVIHDGKFDLKLLSDPTLRKGYGLGNFHEILNASKGLKTPLLNMNLVPTLVNRVDALMALCISSRFLSFVDQQDRRYGNVSQHSILFEGRFYLYKDLVKELYRRWGTVYPEELCFGPFPKIVSKHEI